MDIVGNADLIITLIQNMKWYCSVKRHVSNIQNAFRKRHLEPYLPSHPIVDPMALMKKRARSFGVVSAAPYGSAAILPISWAYVKVNSVILVVLFIDCGCIVF